jgi:hypothetical protein
VFLCGSRRYAHATAAGVGYYADLRSNQQDPDQFDIHDLYQG